jgi:outer membrane beta-barrel protein
MPRLPLVLFALAAAPALAQTPLEEDRIRSVEPKAYLKDGRWAVTPLGSVSVNDAFYAKLGGSLAVSYFLAETLAVGARGTWTQAVAEDDLRTARVDFQSTVVAAAWRGCALAEVEWSPVYGKIRWGDSILHFDGYLLGGVGAAFARRPQMAFDFGLGARIAVREWLAINAALLDTNSVETPNGTPLALIQNTVTLNLGLTVWVPFTSTRKASP